MRKDSRFVIGVVLGLALGAVLLLLFSGGGEWSVEGRTLTVDDDGEAEFTSIQDAINASEDGDTIRVWDGVYVENIALGDSIEIIGNGSVTTEIRSKYPMSPTIVILGNNVTISGITSTINQQEIGELQEPTYVFNIYNIGNNCRLSKNEIIGGYYGYYQRGYGGQLDHNSFIGAGVYLPFILWESGNDIILDSNLVNGKPLVYRKDAEGETIDSDAGQVILNNCSRMTIQGFEIQNVSIGISVYKSDNITFTGNTISRCVTGIDITNSVDCTISWNTLNDHFGTAVSISTSDRIDVINNIITNSSRGIYLHESNSSFISSNHLESNHQSIELFQTSLNILLNNTCMNSTETGIEDIGSYFNRISSNVIIGSGENGIQLNARGSTRGLKIIVEGNQCLGNGISGIHVYRNDEPRIRWNTCNDNMYGIFIEISGAPIIANNSLDNNEDGLRLEGAHRGEISHNHLSNNTNGTVFLHWTGATNFSENSITNCSQNGIFIHGSSQNDFRRNSIESNKNGIVLRKDSMSNSFELNTIKSNIFGITILENSTHLKFHWNNFLENEEYGVMTPFRESRPDYEFENNYWGDPSGPHHAEKNSDGKGDRVIGSANISPWERKPIEKIGVEAPEKEDTLTLLDIITWTVILSAIGAGAMSYFREDLRFLLIAFLTAPLYSKLEKDDILDQPKRQEIFSHIVNRPGSNLTKLHQDLPIGYGTLVHHLKVLEREKHIRSKKEMGRKIFFPTGKDWVGNTDSSRGEREAAETFSREARKDAKERESPAEDGKLVFTPDDPQVVKAQSRRGIGDTANGWAGGRPDSLDNLSSVPVGLRILEHLKESGPSTQKEIEEVLELKQTTVSYSIRKLEEDGKIVGNGETRGEVYKVLE